MALDWHVGDPVRVAPQRDVTELGTGVVIDVDALPDGSAKALLVRFDDGPRAGVWYSAGTMKPLGGALAESPSGGRAAPAPTEGDPRSRFHLPGLLIGKDVLEYGLCRDPALAQRLAALANRDGPRHTLLSGVYELRELLGLPSRFPLRSGLRGEVAMVGDALQISEGPLLYSCYAGAHKEHGLDAYETWRATDRAIDAWEARVETEIALPKPPADQPRTAPSQRATLRTELTPRDVIQAGLTRSFQLADALAEMAAEAQPAKPPAQRRQWLAGWLGLGRAFECSAALPWQSQDALLHLQLKRGPLYAYLSERAGQAGYTVWPLDYDLALNWAEEALGCWEEELQRRLGKRDSGAPALIPVDPTQLRERWAGMPRDLHATLYRELRAAQRQRTQTVEEAWAWAEAWVEAHATTPERRFIWGLDPH